MRFSVPSFLAVLLALLILPAPATAQQTAPSDLVLVLDASGSMWGQVQGEHKIVSARRVLKDLLDGLPASTEVGLVAYGHRREGDCADIETVVPLGPADKAALGEQIDALNPKGKTPITDAVREAIAGIEARNRAATVILVSDGLETCGGDPCAAVREAKAAGVEFVMHVVGFDIGGEDVSQLECAAQAGGGLYLGADDAEGLAAALDQAVAVPADLPAGRLSVEVVAEGTPQDAWVRVAPAEGGDDVASGRTYTGPETNPRVLPLPAGTYEVTVNALGMSGEATQRFSVEIGEEGLVERTVDFTAGELAIGVTRNGAPSDAMIYVFRAGTDDRVASGRSYTSASSNPRVFRITAGTYDAEVTPLEISGNPPHRFEGLVVEGGGRTEQAHDFKSGTLRLGATYGGEMVDAVVRVTAPGSGTSIASGRTYTGTKEFELPLGTYRVSVQPVRPDDAGGAAEQQFDVTIEAGATTEHIVDYGE